MARSLRSRLRPRMETVNGPSLTAPFSPSLTKFLINTVLNQTLELNGNILLYALLLTLLTSLPPLSLPPLRSPHTNISQKRLASILPLIPLPFIFSLVIAIILSYTTQFKLPSCFQGPKPMKPPTVQSPSFGKSLCYEYSHPHKYDSFPELLSLNTFIFLSLLKFLCFAPREESAVIHAAHFKPPSCFQSLKPMKPPTDQSPSFGWILCYEYPYPQNYVSFPEFLLLNTFIFLSVLELLGFALLSKSAVFPDAGLCIEYKVLRSRCLSLLIFPLFYASTYFLELISSPLPPHLPVVRSYQGRSRIVVFSSCYIFMKKPLSIFASARNGCLQSGLLPTADYAHQPPPPSNKSLSLGKPRNDYL